MDSKVYDATRDVLVEDLVFIAINKENELTIEVPFCHLYLYEGEVWDIWLDCLAYRREDRSNLPVGIYDDDFIWRVKRPEEDSVDIKPIKFISACHTKRYCLVIETTENTREYDFRRLHEQNYPDCSFEKFTVKEHTIVFDQGPAIRYTDLYRYGLA